MANNSIFPYLPSNTNSVGQSIAYDLQIGKAYPAVEFIPTEPGGQYQEAREVNGSFCLVTNAQWNANTLRWEQNAPCNPALPAYQLCLNGDGSMVRSQAAPTTIIGQPVAFFPLFTIDKYGQITKSPTVITSGTIAAETAQLKWTAGTSIVLSANEIRIMDTASAGTSLVDAVYVNNTQVWAVQKDGTLVAGKIPFSLVTGFTPNFNNAVFTGTTTFNGPLVANNGVTIRGGETVVGGSTIDNLIVTGNETVGGTLGVTGATTLNGGLSVLGGETVDSLHVTGNETVDGNLTVAGTTTTKNLNVTGTVTSSQSFTTITAANSSIVVTQPTPNNYVLNVPAAPSTVIPSNYYPTNMIYRLGGMQNANSFILGTSSSTMFQTNQGNGSFTGLSQGIDPSFGQQSVIQYETGVRVTPGAGPQILSGIMLTAGASGGTNQISVDTTVAYTQTTSKMFSVTIPDDGAYHYLIFKFTAVTTGSYPAIAFLSNWVPTSSAGGLDTTRFNYIGYPKTAYPF